MIDIAKSEFEKALLKLLQRPNYSIQEGIKKALDKYTEEIKKEIRSEISKEIGKLKNELARR